MPLAPSELIDLQHRKDIRPRKETKNFALRNEDGNEIGVFTGSYPDGRHLKAANRGSYRYQVERTGNKEGHIFTGRRA